MSNPTISKQRAKLSRNTRKSGGRRPPLRSPYLASLFVLALITACTLSKWTGLAPQMASTILPEPATRSPLRTATSSAIPSPTPTPTPAPTPAPTATPLPVRLSVIQISAPALEENLLNEPDEQAVQVYLPPSYETSDLNYPVVYFLPGFGSDAQGNNQYISAEKLTSLMAGGQIKEMILVIPNGANVLHGSFYVNSPVTGNWEDFIVKDVVETIDANYRTIASPEGRGIAGHSMGGFGALNLAMRHPDVFGACYGLSPALFDPGGLGDSLMFDTDEKETGMLSRMEGLGKLSRAEALREMIHSEGAAGFTLAYGTAFAADPELEPPFFKLPFEEKQGKLKRIPKEWERWQNGFGGWPEKIAEFHDNLESLEGILIDYGTEDLPWIVDGSQYLSDQLTEAGISHQIDSFEGTHGSRIEERLTEVMLPFFDEALTKAR